MEKYKDLLRRAINRARVSPNPLMRGGVDAAQAVFRFVGWLFPGLGLGWVSALRSARWDGDDLVLTGWGYVRGARYGPDPSFDVYLGHRRLASAHARHVQDLDVLGAAKRAEQDYRGTTWEARFRGSELAGLPDGAWHLRAKVRGNGRRSGGRVKFAYFFGSPAVVPARIIGGRVIALKPHLDGGVDIVARDKGPGIAGVEVDGRRVTISLSGTFSGKAPTKDSVESAALTGRGQKKVPLELMRVESS